MKGKKEEEEEKNHEENNKSLADLNEISGQEKEPGMLSSELSSRDMESLFSVIHNHQQTLQEAFMGELQTSLDVIDNIMENVIESHQKMMEPIIKNPELVHYSHVREAYYNGKNKMIVILLNVFFESIFEQWLEEAMEAIKEERDTAGSVKKILDKLDYDGKLRFGRILGVISDDTYDILNSIRNARNEFAHNFYKYSISETNTILGSTRLEDAIKLYEKKLKIPSEDSMLKEEEKRLES